MDIVFSRLLEENTPKTNEDIMNGYAEVFMKESDYYIRESEKYLNDVFLSANESFVKGLVYHGYEVCSPIEEFMEVTRVYNNKRSFDLAKFDVYAIKFRFSFEGRELPPRYVYLPFVRDGGIMYVRGAKMHITPILSDKVISPGIDNVFVRLLRGKIIFRRLYHSLIVNGRREIVHVVWSNIHHKTKETSKVPATTKSQTCIVHYLLGKFGFDGMFEKYCGFKPIVGGSEITVDNYPEDQYVICESSQINPRSFIGEYYTPTDIKVVIPIEHWNQLSKSLIAGFYYIVDHFPDRLKVDYLNNTNLWRILLGHIIFSGVFGENKLYKDICEHYNAIDNYVDAIIIKKLKEDQYYIKDFYDLLALLLSKFNSLVIASESTALSVYGKSLEILYYLLYEITAGLFNVNFKLSKKALNKPLTYEEVLEIFSKNLRLRAIRNIASGKIIAESVSYSGDHKYPKLTSKITEQENSPSGSRGRSKRFVLGEDKHLDVSMIEAGSILFLPKANPTPMNKINPFINIDKATSTIIPNPKFVELLERTHRIIKGQT